LSTISVIIPLFNKAQSIERAVRSVLAQTRAPDEVLVVDDGSTDGGDRRVAALAHTAAAAVRRSQLRLIRQSNRGPSAARNRGVREARSEWVAFLDADDEWKPWFLETIERLQRDFPQAAACATAYMIKKKRRAGQIPTHVRIPPPPWRGIVDRYFHTAQFSSPVWTSAVAVERAAFDALGGFVDVAGLGQDRELWARIALCHPIAYDTQVCAIYHQEGANRRCRTVKRHVFTTDCFERFVAARLRGKTVTPEFLDDVYDYIAMEKLVAAGHAVLNEDPQTARAVLGALRNRKYAGRKLWWTFWAALPPPLTAAAWWGRQKLDHLQMRLKGY
jgi:cellulose synthase/poly-beta-1,6-N-acetylglucosamine synthase-like glycosyltransferase